jgi:uncharacterized membrane protein
MQSDKEIRRGNRIVEWGFVGLVVIVFALIVTSFVLRATPSTSGVPSFPFFGFGWFLIPLVFFGLFWAFRWSCWPWGYGGGYYRYQDDAYEILRERYASGQITKEQFEKMNEDQVRKQVGENTK